MSDNQDCMRPWDSFDAYLFDIDGTLLNCTDAVHYSGFCEVLSKVAGRPINLDGVTTHGNVDPGILRDALDQAGIDEGRWRTLLPEMCDNLCRYVEAHAEDFRIEVLPGVRALLSHLQAKGAMLGAATGNLERVGWAKLGACGLAQAFTFGGFSDGMESRASVFAAAAAKARSLAGNARAGICVFGDTPADIHAARANNLSIIAVATGIFSAADLEQAGPDSLILSMADLLPELSS